MHLVFEKCKKFGMRATSVMIALTFVAGIFLSSAPSANAFTIPVIDLQVNGRDIVNDFAVPVVVQSVMSAANYFAQNLAYKLASDITSGCKGLSPCFESRSVADILKDSAGEAIGEMNKALNATKFGKLGFDLCKPNAAMLINIQLGLFNIVKPKPPTCSWSQLSQNWSTFKDTLDSRGLLNQVKVQFSPGQAGLSASFTLFTKAQDLIGQKEKESILADLRKNGAGGFSGVEDAVSGRVKSPAKVVEEAHAEYNNRKAQGEKVAESAIAAQIAKGALLGVVNSFVGTFVQTLASYGFNRLAKGLLSTEELIAAQPNVILNEDGTLQPPGPLPPTSERFVTTPSRNTGISDILTDFSTCPNAADLNRTPQNCAIDAQFAQAVRAADGGLPLTVQEAISTGLLNGEWALIPPKNVAKNKDPFCYTYAYCDSNLKKLRAARILPIGWELAAESPANDPDSPVKLKTVVAKFNECNAQGLPDANFPWCHLIDPDWVLKAPLTQCRAQVFGPVLTSASAANRAQICVDQPSCIQQDANGNCIGGWGYCTREKNDWVFNGDSCPAQYSSCRALTQASTGAQKNFLLNTVNYGVCNAGNSGCTAYSLNQNTGAANVASDPSDDWAVTPTRYLNAQATKCPATDNGCTGVIPLDPLKGDSLNLVRNGGFDTQEDGDSDGTPDHAKYWFPAGNVVRSAQGAVPNGFLSSDGSRSSSGSNAIFLATPNAPRVNTTCTVACTNSKGCPCTSPSGVLTCRAPDGSGNVGNTSSCFVTDRVLQDRIPVKSRTTYTVSAAFRADDTARKGAVAGKIFVSFRNVAATGEQVVALTQAQLAAQPFFDTPVDQSPAATCAVATNPYTNQPSVVLSFTKAALLATDSGTSDVTASCSFSVTAPISLATIELASNGAPVWADNVQLEEGGGTAYRDGYGASAPAPVYAKVAPDYLQCSGSASDNAQCASFAKVCSASEVGCEKYTPANGDPFVPGIVGPNDICPAACVGYDVFKQRASTFDSEKFPVYFIPTTARACTSAEVGCSEFTSLANEQKQYYSQVRICQSPTLSDSTTYYTWEGSDTAGYQLKIWNLKRTGAPVATSVSDVPAISGASPGTAPCTRINAQNVCIDNDQDGLCSRADLDAGNFGCREFYDAAENRHYRLLSKTILATTDCAAYRITTSTSQDCDKSNGTWDAEKQQCVYQVSAGNSASCSAQYNGCRAYNGNAAANVRNTLTDTFENGTDSWFAGLIATRPQVATQISSDAVTVGGKSAKIPQVVTGPARQIYKDVTSATRPGRTYTLSFWAKGQGQLTPSFQDDTIATSCTLAAPCTVANATNVNGTNVCTCRATNGLTCAVSPTPVAPATNTGCTIAPRTSQPVPPAFSATTISGTWNQYTVGPVEITDSRWATGPELLVMQSAGTSDVFIDNIVLKEVQDNIYVVRNSWNTPAQCDQTSTGAPSPLAMLGCRAYTDSTGAKLNLKSFSQLCREQSVGCKAYSATQNTVQNPYDEAFNAVCTLPVLRYPGSVCTGSSPCPCNYTMFNPAYASGAIPGTPVLARDNVCTVRVGETSCRFSLDTQDFGGGASLFPDRVNIVSDSRKYLVVTQANSCPATSLGCTMTGVPTKSYTRSCAYGPGAGIIAPYSVCVRNANAQPVLQANGDAIECAGGGFCPTGSTCRVQQTKCLDPAGCFCSLDLNVLNCVIPTGQSQCTVALENGAVASWTANPITDDPSQYNKTLCTASALSCDTFTTSDGPVYFKDPGNQTCTYRQNIPNTTICQNKTSTGAVVTCPSGAPGGGCACLKNGLTCQILPGSNSCSLNVPVSGWFRTGSTGAAVPCSPGLLKNGNTFDIAKNADQSCTLAAQCGTVSGCGCPAIGAQVCRVAYGQTSCGYQGWVGECSAQVDRCEEFLDPLDTSVANPKGKPYYYLNNTKLDKTTCAGSVSIKQGCVLFNETINTTTNYSAAATYLRSAKTASNGPVAPVNCTGANASSQYCGGRCMSIKNGSCPNGRKCTQNADCGTGLTCTGDADYGFACLVDSDCDQANGEKCDATAAAAPKDDANVILNVKRDRQCAQWLTCQVEESVFDSNTNKWRSVCSQVGLCDQFAQNGQAFDCTSWVSAPKKLLTKEEYASRDVTYRGSEYSGFSLPGKYPAQYVTSALVSQGQCMSRTRQPLYDSNNNIRYCSVATDCTVSNGEYCSPPMQGECSTAADGAASNLLPFTNNPSQKRWCNTNADCNALETVQCNVAQGAAATDRTCSDDRTQPCRSVVDCYRGVSFCKLGATTTRYGIALTTCGGALGGQKCTDDTDCPSATACSLAQCQTDSQCPGDTPNTNGKCYENKCMYALSGGPLQLPATQSFDINTASCRGYPTIDAPYDASVVQTTTNAGGPGNTSVATSQPITAGYDQNGNVASLITGFQSVNTCTKGNVCDCSYEKVTYGSNSSVGSIRFHSYGNAFPPPYGKNSVYGGVCVGGPIDGSQCIPPSSTPPAGVAPAPDTQCGQPGEGGRCVAIAKIDYAVGWPGFCLDQDTSLTLNGNPSQYGCNLWLPVDQLVGAPNNWNQDRQAGYVPPNSALLYCQVAEGNARVNPPVGARSYANNYEVLLHDEINSPISGPWANRGVAGQIPGCASYTNEATCGRTPTNRVGTLPPPFNQYEIQSSSQCYWNKPGNPNGTCKENVMLQFSNGGGSVNNEQGYPMIFDCQRAFEFLVGETRNANCGPTWGTCARDLLRYIQTNSGFQTCIPNPNYSPPLNPGNWSAWFKTRGDDSRRVLGIDMSSYLLYKHQLAGIRFDFPTDNQRFMYLYPSPDGVSATDNWTNAHYWNNRDDGINSDDCENNPGDTPEDCVTQGNGDRQRAGSVVGEDPGTSSGTSTKGCANLLDPTSLSDQQVEDLCERKGETTKYRENCLAAKANFDPTGKLISIDTVLCHNGAFYGGDAPVRATALLRENCLEVAELNRPSNPLQSIPVTSVLMNSSATFTNVGGVSLSPITQLPNKNGTVLAPFGAFSLSQLPVSVLSTPPGTGQPQERLVSAFQSEGGSLFTAVNWQVGTTFDRSIQNNPTTPFCASSGAVESNNNRDTYACQVVFAGNQLPSLLTLVALYNYTYNYTTNANQKGEYGTSNASAQYFPPDRFDPYTAVPYACIGACGSGGTGSVGVPQSAQNKGTQTQAATYGAQQLSTVFALAWNVYSWDTTRAATSYTLKPPGDNGRGVAWDNRESIMVASGAGNQAPRVIAPDTSNCVALGNCRETVTGITVNNRSTGIVNGVNGRLSVTLQFYGAANKDHMPIRRKIVDFGDGKSFSSVSGYYKNRRGTQLVAGQEQPLCDSTEWGKTPQSCDQMYFQEQKIYLCSRSNVGPNGTLQNCDGSRYPCQRTGACVFKPRVQLMDNWQVCNGRCPDITGSPSRNGAYCVNYNVDFNSSYSTGRGDATTGQECEFAQTDRYDAPSQPWDAFAGEIVVTPR